MHTLAGEALAGQGVHRCRVDAATIFCDANPTFCELSVQHIGPVAAAVHPPLYDHCRCLRGSLFIAPDTIDIFSVGAVGVPGGLEAAAWIAATWIGVAEIIFEQHIGTMRACNRGKLRTLCKCTESGVYTLDIGKSKDFAFYC